MPERQVITVTVNGRSYARSVEPRLLLSDFLRHELRLTGTHVGCEHGVCGACTVLVDDELARSCLMLAVQVDGAHVTTVEGLTAKEADDGDKRLLTTKGADGGYNVLLTTKEADGGDDTLLTTKAPDGGLHPVQQAFWDAHGLQCGFCTSGMLITTVALLRANPHPTDTEIRVALSGNLCRCTGYQNIVKAVRLAAERINQPMSRPPERVTPAGTNA